MNWTDERIAELKHMHGEGMTGGQIADAMGISRNAAIGKIHRLGLYRSEEERARRRGWRKSPRPKRPRGDGGIAVKVSHSVRRAQNFAVTHIRRPATDAPEPMPTTDADDLAIPLEQRRTLMQLDATTCRWPVGEGVDLFFCGAMPVEGFSYCGPHCRRAFAGVPDGARRRPFIAARRNAA